MGTTYSNPTFTLGPEELYLGNCMALVLISYFALSYFRSAIREWQTERRAAKRRQERDAKKFKFPEVTPDKERKILEAKDVGVLRDMQIRREVTSVDIVSVFSQRAHTIGRKLNYVTEEYYTEALQMAEQRDQETLKAIKDKKTNELGRLHGIPVSIKDHVGEKGRISTVGCSHFADNVCDEDAVCVRLIKEDGGIPFVKSNNPQIVFSMNTDNHIYGIAQNPWDTGRTTSGSSGGEGGLVATRCSPMGLGTDIGGSIRGPAAFCGVYGFKPTPYRTSYSGSILPVPDNSLPQSTVHPSMGPLAYSVNDLLYMTQTLFQSYRYDSNLPPLPFNQSTYDALLSKSRRPLRIGYYDSLPNFESSSAVKRAINLAKDKLQVAGCTLVPFKISLEENLELKKGHTAACVIGAFGQLAQALQSNGESPIRVYKLMFFFYGLPRFFQRFIRNIVHMFLSSRMALTMDWVKKYSSEEIDEILRAKDRFDRHFNERWETEQLDGMISPAYYHTAFKHEDDADMGLNADYTSIWNLLHFPAGIVPVSEVQKEEDSGYTDSYNDILTKKYKENVEGSAGLPLCVQVSTRKWKDEECLAIMKILDDQVQLPRRHFEFSKVKPYEPKSSFLLTLINFISLLLQASFYIFAGYSHFAKPHYFEEMMPNYLPYHRELNLISGFFEILLGLALLIPQTRRFAAWGIIALLFAVLPANFHIAIYNVPVFGALERPGWKAWARIPIQWLLIWWARIYTK